MPEGNRIFDYDLEEKLSKCIDEKYVRNVASNSGISFEKIFERIAKKSFEFLAHCHICKYYLTNDDDSFEKANSGAHYGNFFLSEKGTVFNVADIDNISDFAIDKNTLRKDINYLLEDLNYILYNFNFKEKDRIVYSSIAVNNYINTLKQNGAEKIISKFITPMSLEDKIKFPKLFSAFEEIYKDDLDKSPINLNVIENDVSSGLENNEKIIRTQTRKYLSGGSEKNQKRLLTHISEKLFDSKKYQRSIAKEHLEEIKKNPKLWERFVKHNKQYVDKNISKIHEQLKEETIDIKNPLQKSATLSALRSDDKNTKQNAYDSLSKSSYGLRSLKDPTFEKEAINSLISNALYSSDFDKKGKRTNRRTNAINELKQIKDKELIRETYKKHGRLKEKSDLLKETKENGIFDKIKKIKKPFLPGEDASLGGLFSGKKEDLTEENNQQLNHASNTTTESHSGINGSTLFNRAKQIKNKMFKRAKDEYQEVKSVLKETYDDRIASEKEINDFTKKINENLENKARDLGISKKNLMKLLDIGSEEINQKNITQTDILDTDLNAAYSFLTDDIKSIQRDKDGGFFMPYKISKISKFIKKHKYMSVFLMGSLAYSSSLTPLLDNDINKPIITNKQLAEDSSLIDQIEINNYNLNTPAELSTLSQPYFNSEDLKFSLDLIKIIDPTNPLQTKTSVSVNIMENTGFINESGSINADLLNIGITQNGLIQYDHFIANKDKFIEILAKRTHTPADEIQEYVNKKLGLSDVPAKVKVVPLN
ncbi:MAG: hypothetical protein KAQ92_09125, partial [Candidatus Aenigmarchaeota archaeon]|nr:hypothetical protein [Candidatus Aenigmarchaeota archaeon]